MSNYHVLDGDDRGKNYRVVFHITVPTTVNKAGVTITTAVIEDPAHTSASIVPHIGSTETSALVAGTLYEHIFTFQTTPGHTALADQNRLDSIYTAYVTKVQTALIDKYAFWHLDRDVP